jgi:hypothetical protein
MQLLAWGSLLHLVTMTALDYTSVILTSTRLQPLPSEVLCIPSTMICPRNSITLPDLLTAPLNNTQIKTSEVWWVGVDNSEEHIVSIFWVCGIYVG